MSRFLIIALTLTSSITSTLAQNAVGASCTSTFDCTGRCVGPTGSKKCCASGVTYSCDGCGSDGSCNFCSSDSQKVNADKTGCVSKNLPVGASCKKDNWCASGYGSCKGEYTSYNNPHPSENLHCCDSSVQSDCDGCGSDGMCNNCTDTPYTRYTVDATRTGCTEFIAAIGAVCISSSECTNQCAQSDTYDKTQVGHCCNADVSYTCDGCDSTGSCSYCGDDELNDDKTGCISSGGGGGGYYGLPNETGTVAGGIAGVVVIMIIGIVVGIFLSKKKPNEASMNGCCCCCTRSVAILTNIITLSVILVMCCICLSQTYLGMMATVAGAMGGSRGVELYVTVPVLLGCFTAVGALSTLGINRMNQNTCAIVMYSLTILIGLGVIGELIFMLIAVGMQYMVWGAPGYGLYCYFIIFLTIALLVFAGMEVCGCCCCCTRPDADPFDNAQNIVQNPANVIVVNATAVPANVEMK